MTPIDGLTPDQRFFLAYAQSWRERSGRNSCACSCNRTNTRRRSIRVNGPLSNLPAFAQAFACKAGRRHGAQRRRAT